MPSIIKKSDGKYLVRVSRGTGTRRVWINKTFEGTRKEAIAFAHQQEMLIATGRVPGGGRIRFRDFKAIWLEAVKMTIQPLTWDFYEGHIRRCTVPLDDLRIDEIGPHHIQAVYNELSDRPATVNGLHATLGVLFNDAIRKGLIRDNPCKYTNRPRKQRPGITVLNAGEARGFLDICRGSRNGVIFEFALETGMRPEEYLAARWSDLTGGEVSIQQVVQFNRKGGGYYFKEPKTARSRRRVPVSEAMRFRLTGHRREQNEHRLAMKRTWFNHDLIFPDTIGKPLPITNLTRRYFRPILQIMWPPVILPDGTERPNPDAKPLTLYSLRHSCATLLLMAGVNPKVVADRLGHSSIVQTLDTYSHVLPHIQADATSILDGVLRMAK